MGGREAPHRHQAGPAAGRARHSRHEAVTPPAGLVHALQVLADFADIRGDSEEAAALRRAATEIEAMPPAAVAEVERRARRNRLDPEGLSRASADTGESRDPFNAAVHAHLRELTLRGSATALRTAQAGLPALFRRLLELRAIGSDEAAMLARQGILTAADLQTALDDNRIRNGGRRHARGAAAFGPAALEPEGRRSRSVAPGIPPAALSTTSSAALPPWTSSLRQARSGAMSRWSRQS